MKSNSPAIYLQGPIVEVTGDQIRALRKTAQESPAKRARYCLHRDNLDPVQEMIIAFESDSYVPPHRHLDRSESFHMMEGSVDVVFFDDAGKVSRRVRLSADLPKTSRFYRLNSAMWHTVILVSAHAVLHETTAGPFNSTQSELPPWAPSAADPAGIAAFLERVLREVESLQLPTN